MSLPYRNCRQWTRSQHLGRRRDPSDVQRHQGRGQAAHGDGGGRRRHGGAPVNKRARLESVISAAREPPAQQARKAATVAATNPVATPLWLPGQLPPTGKPGVKATGMDGEGEAK